MPDIKPDYWEDPANWMLCRWRACDDNVIGGWCVVHEDDTRTPAEGAVQIANFVTEEVAGHMARLHNSWLTQFRVRAAQAGLIETGRENVP